MSRTPVPFAPDTLESIRRAFRVASDRRHDLVSLEHMARNQSGAIVARAVRMTLVRMKPEQDGEG